MSDEKLADLAHTHRWGCVEPGCGWTLTVEGGVVVRPPKTREQVLEEALRQMVERHAGQLLSESSLDMLRIATQALEEAHRLSSDH